MYGRYGVSSSPTSGLMMFCTRSVVPAWTDSTVTNKSTTVAVRGDVKNVVSMKEKAIMHWPQSTKNKSSTSGSWMVNVFKFVAAPAAQLVLFGCREEGVQSTHSRVPREDRCPLRSSTFCAPGPMLAEKPVATAASPCSGDGPPA